MEQAYVLTGELRDGRSLVLDEAVPLAAGKVRVTVEAIVKAQVEGSGTCTGVKSKPRKIVSVPAGARVVATPSPVSTYETNRLRVLSAVVA